MSPEESVERAFHFALQRHQAGDLSEAERIYREQVLNRRPGHPGALHYLGVIHLQRRQFETAIDLLARAAAALPNDAGVRINLANALKAAGRLSQAEATYRDALRLNPNVAEAWFNLAALLRQDNRLEPAADAYDRGLALKSDLGAATARAQLIPPLPSDPAEIARWRSHMRDSLVRLGDAGIRVPLGRLPLHQTNFHLAYHGLDDRPLQELTAATCLRLCPDLAWTAAHVAGWRRRPPRRRPRVAAVSAFFNRHGVGRVFSRLFATRDRAAWELVLCRLPGPADDIASAFDAAADSAVELARDLRRAREQIAALEADIVFYPEIGMHPFIYQLGFARLAPVQVVAWGHPDTTGLPEIDYYLSTAAFEPAEAAAHYRERLILLDNVLANFRRPPVPDDRFDRARIGVPTNQRLYLSVQSLFKYHPDQDAAFAEILRRDLDGVIMLCAGKTEGWGERLRARFAARHPDVAGRFRLFPLLRHADFLALLREADAVLDTWHFGGGITAHDCIAAGAPVVTLPGAFMRGRLNYGLYRKIGVTETVARDPADYVARALALAQDPTRRERIGNDIAENGRSLFDNADAVAELEAFWPQALEAARRDAPLPAGTRVRC